MSWLLWLMLAALLVLPVILRFRVGDEPDNAMRQESGDGDHPGPGTEEAEIEPLPDLPDAA